MSAATLALIALVIAVVVDDMVRRQFVAAIEAALEHAHVSEGDACALMDIRQNQWSEQKAGIGHLSLTRMMLLPDDFWWFFAAEIAEMKEIPAVVQAAARLRTRDRGVLKMRLREPRKERHRA